MFIKNIDNKLVNGLKGKVINFINKKEFNDNLSYSLDINNIEGPKLQRGKTILTIRKYKIFFLVSFPLINKT
jgi:hypothetical protein